MTDFPAQITFELPLNCSIPDDQIFITVLGKDPDDLNKFGYLDFATNTLQANWSLGDFQLNSQTMVKTLAEIKALKGRYTVPVPPINSGRVYFAFRDNFDKMGYFPSSGPSCSKDNPVLYDKLELHTADDPNINATCVDFYGVSYKVTAIDRNTGQVRAIGFDTPRSKILAAFEAIPDCPDDQQNGNTNILKQLLLKNDRETVRILSPKLAALTDWAGVTLDENINNAYKCSHFLDEYVNNHCWKPGRTFSCYSKDYNPAINNSKYYGRVSEDGQTLDLFTDEEMQVAYHAVPTLPRPSNPWMVPSFDPPPPGQPSRYHNIDSNYAPIDWGFLLLGNTGSPQGLGQYWDSDPVAMAIMVSICRGVMHYDDGCNKWIKPSYYYLGDGQGNSSSAFPIFYYAKILHQLSIENKAYVLSFDDVYGGVDPTIYFGGYPDITINFADF